MDLEMNDDERIEVTYDKTWSSHPNWIRKLQLYSKFAPSHEKPDCLSSDCDEWCGTHTASLRTSMVNRQDISLLGRRPAGRLIAEGDLQATKFSVSHNLVLRHLLLVCRLRNKGWLTEVLKQPVNHKSWLTGFRSFVRIPSTIPTGTSRLDIWTFGLWWTICCGIPKPDFCVVQPCRFFFSRKNTSLVV